MKVLLISGSQDIKSHTRVLMEEIASHLSRRKVAAQIWDLAQEPLPAFSSKLPTHSLEPVEKFRQEVACAGAVILGSPVYHGSYSGVLKSALDYLATHAFQGKVVGLVSHGAGVRGCTLPCEHLRSVVRNLCGWVLPTELGCCREDFEKSQETYRIINTEINARCRRLCDELVLFSKTTTTTPLPERSSLHDFVECQLGNGLSVA